MNNFFLVYLKRLHALFVTKTKPLGISCNFLVAKVLWNGLSTFLKKSFFVIRLDATGCLFGLPYYRIIYYWCLNYTCIKDVLMDSLA